MNAADIRRFKLELLDEIHELATEPVADPEALRTMINDFFKKLETENVNGEEG